MLKFCVIIYMLTLKDLGKHLYFIIIRRGLNLTLFSREFFIFTVAGSLKVCSAVQSMITFLGVDQWRLLQLSCWNE